MCNHNGLSVDFGFIVGPMGSIKFSVHPADIHNGARLNSIST